MRHLEPNTIDGLLFGMNNFDSIETDIRLTKDDKLLLHHDPFDKFGRYISEMTMEQCLKHGLPSLTQLLEHKEIHDLAVKGKKMWIEFKPNCQNKKSIHTEIVTKLYDKFVEEVDQSGIKRDAIKILSFQQEFLNPVAEDDIFPAYLIHPYINECNNDYIMLKAFPRIIRHNIKWQIKDAMKKNFKGVLIARQYLMGPISLLNPTYDKLCDLMDSTGMEIGTNLGSVELEKIFPRFHRFSDKTQKYPRYAKKGEGLIVAHRGTGTKGVNIPDDSEKHHLMEK